MFGFGILSGLIVLPLVGWGVCCVVLVLFYSLAILWACVGDAGCELGKFCFCALAACCATDTPLLAP